MSFANTLNTIAHFETKKPEEQNDDKIKIHRNSYNGMDWAPLCEEIDLEMGFQNDCLKIKKTTAIQIVALRHKKIPYETLKKYYKYWCDDDRPLTYTHEDYRFHNTKNRILSDESEQKLVKILLSESDNGKQVSYLTVRKYAIQIWKELPLDYTNGKDFFASDGWIGSFMRRHGLSSQRASSRSSCKKHVTMADKPVEVQEFKETFHQFVEEHGMKNVVNFDETFFGGHTGQARTIARKNSRNQPRIKTHVAGRGLSIGCSTDLGLKIDY